MGPHRSSYACEGAYVFRLAAPEADHYFFINDEDARSVRLDTGDCHYTGATDPVSGESVDLSLPIALPAHTGRWQRLTRKQ